MQSGAYTVWKKVGETPLQALEAFRREKGIPPVVPMTYAGRLDPMAEGELLLLWGEECKRREEYTKLDKIYEFEVLLGVESDTGDVLGITRADESSPEVDVARANEALTTFLGANSFPYPNFSSKTVHGKPLHQWALEGKLDEIEIPEYDSIIYSVELLNVTTSSTEQISQYVFGKLSLFDPDPLGHEGLGGDFRKPAILECWRGIFKIKENRTWQVLRCRAKVSSGTYIRTLSAKIAERLGTKGLALSITRTWIDFK